MPGLPLCLKLKKAAGVMITFNINLSNWLINSQFGIGFAFGYVSFSITKVHLKLDDEKAGKNTILKDPYASKHKLILNRKIETNIKINKSPSKTFERDQIPLTLAWACTIQKAQGLTLHATVVSLQLVKQIPLSPGQFFVALSRLTYLAK